MDGNFDSSGVVYHDGRFVRQGAALMAFKRHTWSDEDYRILRHMTDAGARTRDIAAAIGASVNAINLKRQRSGIKRPVFSDIERFRRSYVVDEVTACWVWQRSTGGGYGFFTPTPADGRTFKSARAHRWYWEQVNGPVPEGLELDHLCRNRSCCNPAHLEAVTHQENCRRGLAGAHMAAKTHCPRGHAYAGENVVVRNGSRNCRTCERQRQVAAYRQKVTA
jgi:hypothetical protein